jgi:hypothetical protein
LYDVVFFEISKCPGENGVLHVCSFVEDDRTGTIKFALGFPFLLDRDMFLAGEVGGEGDVGHLSDHFYHYFLSASVTTYGVRLVSSQTWFMFASLLKGTPLTFSKAEISLISAFISSFCFQGETTMLVALLN